MRAVLDVVQASDSHPSAQEIYEAVRRARPHIGMATVYRAVRQLAASGLIKEVDRSAISSRYDGRTDRHDHAICTQCGVLIDLPVNIAVLSDSLQDAVCRAGLELSSHEVRLYGRCRSCLDKEKEGVAVHEAS